MMVANSKRYTRLFSELIPAGVDLPSYKDRPIQSVQIDSRKVKVGDLFLAVQGVTSDGRQYIQDAIDKGAAAVLAEAGIQASDLLSLKSDVPVIEVDSLGDKVGEIAAKFFGQPSQAMSVVGITGTNGKTTVSYLLAQAFDLLQESCGLVGTLGWGFARGGKLNRTINTTPDPVSLQKILFDLNEEGAKFAAMEVSSHGLEQGRLSGTVFKTGVLTNISHDHLDYHGSMEAYVAAKGKLLSWPGVEQLVINTDDVYCRQLLADLAAGPSVLTYGLDYAQRPDITANNIVLGDNGIEFNLLYLGAVIPIEAKLYGRFNVANLLAVAAVLFQFGYSAEQVQQVIAELNAPVGRMQQFKGKTGPRVIVDYAHTPDALEKLLAAVREHSDGAITTVFGCGGDRDASKRPLMGKIAEQWSEGLVLTNDNPRSEDPKKIVHEIEAGLTGTVPLTIKLDRSIAIQTAIYTAKENDVVVVAGKGHENYQDIDGSRMAFSDIELVRKTLNDLGSSDGQGIH